MRIVIGASLAASLINFRGELIRELLADGAEVHVTAPDFESDSDSSQTLSEWGVTVHQVAMSRTGMNPWRDMLSLAAYRRLFRKLRPDAYLGYTAKPVIYGVLAAWLVGVPRRVAMITGLGYGFQGDSRRAFLRAVVSNLYRAALRRATNVIFQNPDDLRTFQSLALLSPHSKTSVVNGSGVDLAKFKPHPLPEGPLIFLMIARLLGDKGVREYVSAARLIAQEHSGVRFLLVGPRDPGPDAIPAAELAQWVSEGIVDYLGEQRDVRPFLAACSVYVLPSYREGTPRSVLEAMATGRPVITTDAPGCRQTVEDGVNGFLVEPKSVVAVAEAMRRFIVQPALTARMVDASLAKVRDEFDVRRVNQVIQATIYGGDFGRASV
jgi:glycosyltransferase involved in cell wall biosynthesis